jgi:hypothetical protein
MPETDPDSKPASLPGVVVALLASFAPVAYVLSTGPAHWLMSNGHISSAWVGCVHSFYEPLRYCCLRLPMLNDFVHWWVSIWQ